MGLGESHQTAVGDGRSVRQAWQYLRRTLFLKCPVCGTKPVFKPWRQVRSFYDWFTPLDGCPRCGYPYEREPGYFLLAIFGFNYGFGALVGVAAALAWTVSGHMADAPVWKLLVTVILPVPIANVLIARHAKVLFIALDHFVDPFVHEPDDDGPDDDDDNGNKRLKPAPPADGGGGGGEPVVYEDKPADGPGALVGAGRR